MRDITRDISRRLLRAATLALLYLVHVSHAAEPPSVAAGVQQCDHGHYTLAVATLQEAYRAALAGAERAEAAGALGVAYAQLRQPGLAQRYLREAHDTATDAQQRARHALDLANLAASQRDWAQARAWYAAVPQLAGDDAALTLAAALNSVSLAAPGQRLALLEPLLPQIEALPRARDRASYALHLGTQARAARQQPHARELAYKALASGLRAAQQGDGEARLAAAAYGQLAQLYEDTQRLDDAMLLNTRGIARAQAAQAPPARDLLIELEWRRGRLLAAQGQQAAAITAYQRAVNQIEALRPDIPVEYENGRSSFRDTLEPVYLGLADLLLQEAAALPPERQAAQYRLVRDTLERIKQTELEDFLGSRCAVEGARSAPGVASAEVPVAKGTAVLYPVILPDRLELLVETSAGIQRRTVAVPAAVLRRDAAAFAAALRARQPYLDLAQRLHRALLAPVQPLLQQAGVQTLVVVPDSVLRLVPFGALHDGQRYAIERQAISVVPAVTLPEGDAERSDSRPVRLLLAGMSEPGRVVEKLPDYLTAPLLADAGPLPTAVPGRGEFSRGMKKIDPAAPRPAPTPRTPAEQAARNRVLQTRLALTGVAEEVDVLARLAPSTTMLNQAFSVRSFSDQVKSGDYRVVHIASHGVFGSTAGTTFIMAHDDLITIDQLQSFLGGASLRDRPIELLTLSACETAEGDDRAPLGLSGAALKARARSAMGSLWPVSDDAAKLLMSDFYRGLVQSGLRDKARALQAAQVRMLGQPALQHPYYWAPFILVERRL